MSSPTSKPPKMTPYRTMRGHTERVRDVVHLPGGRIITCSNDGSLRLWDLEKGIQIGDDWRDGVDEEKVPTIALSPNGSTMASGSGDGTMRLWDVKTGKVTTVKRKVHTDSVRSMCWSGDGERVMSGSDDEIVRVWDVKSGEAAVWGPINTGHKWVAAVVYSPDSTKFATCGSRNGVKIWDAKTGELLTTLKHEHWVFSLAWTSDGKKFMSGSFGQIRIFDTATWQQIATLGDHKFYINAITLSQNERLLASVSSDRIARLWNLDTNLQVGPPLQHDHWVQCAALSADGKVLVTGGDNDVYAWDIHTILKKAGLEDLLLPIPIPHVPKPPMNRDATRRPPVYARRIPPGFFNEDDIRSPTLPSIHHSSSHRILAPSMGSARALFTRIPSLFHRPHSHTNGVSELQRTTKQGFFSRRSPPTVEVAAVRDKQTLAVAPQLAKRTQQQQQNQSHGQGSSLQSQPAATSTSTTQPVPNTNSSTQATISGAVTVQSRLLTLLARLVLLICCAPLPSADGH